MDATKEKRKLKVAMAKHFYFNQKPQNKPKKKPLTNLTGGKVIAVNLANAMKAKECPYTTMV